MQQDEMKMKITTNGLSSPSPEFHQPIHVNSSYWKNKISLKEETSRFLISMLSRPESYALQ
jgi:hypothetical protein